MENRHYYRFGFQGQFLLTLDSTGRLDKRGQEYVHYRLKHDGKLIFEGTDYSPSPMIHNSLGSESARVIIGFLSCRFGWDTDDKYFKNYTQEQKDFSVQYGEEMSLWSQDDNPEPFLRKKL